MPMPLKFGPAFAVASSSLAGDWSGRRAGQSLRTSLALQIAGVRIAVRSKYGRKRPISDSFHLYCNAKCPYVQCKDQNAVVGVGLAAYVAPKSDLKTRWLTSRSVN